MKRFNNKACLSQAEQGLSAALRTASEGASVMIFDQNQQAAEAVVEHVKLGGKQPLSLGVSNRPVKEMQWENYRRI